MADIIALVFDLDDTLLPDSTTQLLASRGIDTDHFWKVEAKALSEQGYDPTVSYLNLILEKVGSDKPLGNLTIQDLREFGKTLDDKFFPNLDTLLQDLRELVKQIAKDISVEMYIVSGGIQDVIDGSNFIRENFEACYGCQFGADDDGLLKRIKRTITFSEKTRYLFEINKGLRPQDTARNQYLVNQHIEESKRRIPLQNMIYVGDGLTDIPCFSLIQKNGGTAFGIMKKETARRTFLEFLKTGRVSGAYSPRFGTDDDLGMLLRAAVASTASRILIERKQVDARFY